MNTVSFAATTSPQTIGAIDIGMSALGCTGDDGKTFCRNFKNGRCSGTRANNCMSRAMVDHPETQAEIVLASISLMARTATSGKELLRMLPRVERVIEETACA